MEPFDLKFHVYDVHEDCTTLELGKKEIPGYNPSQGLGYYEFTQAEYISPKAKVMLMNQVWYLHKHSKLNNNNIMQINFCLALSHACFTFEACKLEYGPGEKPISSIFINRSNSRQ